MSSKNDITRMKKQMKKWEEKLNNEIQRKAEYVNSSGIQIDPTYNSEVENNRFDKLSMPGEYPYTRGIHPTMYRGKIWTMRMFSGFGTPEDTNNRLKYLIKNGQTGLSVAFDMPTLYGYDADDPRSNGEVGKCGCNVSSLEDMNILFQGIPLDKVSTSMTINAPASILTAMYAVLAKKKRIPLSQLRGTVQTDILKEYIAQKEWSYPPEAHMRIIRDMMKFSTKEMKKWNYISISGYHIREAGADAVQELAFTLANGFTYIDLGVNAGLKIKQFAPRMSFFFNSCMNFFEEIAKFRAARRIWATVLKEKYKVTDEKALLLKFHTQTSGASLTWQQPFNNIMRTTIEALAAVLGGTQSLHTNSYDEAWALPTEEAVRIALRTQQVIAEETGVTDTVDPMGGSYYIEWLTDELEEKAYRYFDKIEKRGGVIECIKSGYLQREIANTSYKSQIRIERKKEKIVGVNEYTLEEESPISTLRVDLKAQKKQIARLKQIKKTRNNKKVEKALQELRDSYRDESKNCMYPTMNAVSSYATLQEIIEVGKEVFGERREHSII